MLWTNEDSADKTVHKVSGKTNELEPGMCVIIGLVSTKKLFVGPAGNYNPSFSLLSKAKFQFTLKNPSGEFSPDFVQEVENIKTLQAKCVKTGDHKYLIIKNGRNKVL